MVQKILDFCGNRSDRRLEIAQASFVLSRIEQRRGNLDEYERLRAQAVEAFNESHSAERRTVKTLTWEDIRKLVHYDFLYVG